jgi:hypothetical protein
VSNFVRRFYPFSLSFHLCVRLCRLICCLISLRSVSISRDITLQTTIKRIYTPLMMLLTTSTLLPLLLRRQTRSWCAW